jgi:hypothetical protein
MGCGFMVSESESANPETLYHNTVSLSRVQRKSEKEYERF